MADTVYKPIRFDSPRLTSLGGNAYWDVDYLATADVDLGSYHFTKDVDGKHYGLVTAPASVGPVPAPAIVLVCLWNAIVGVSRLSCSVRLGNESTTLDGTLTAAGASQDITVPATAWTPKVLTFPLAVAPAVLDRILVEIFHEGGHVNDTVAIETLVWEAYLRIDRA